MALAGGLAWEPPCQKSGLHSPPGLAPPEPWPAGLGPPHPITPEAASPRSCPFLSLDSCAGLRPGFGLKHHVLREAFIITWCHPPSQRRT